MDADTRRYIDRQIAKLRRELMALVEDLPSGETKVIQAGTQGKPGLPGNDGYSPTVTVTEEGSSVIISVTDINGTTSVSIEPGDKNTWETE